MPHSDTEHTEQAFVEKLRQTLNDQPIDAETRQRLNRIRSEVLSQTNRRRWMPFTRPSLVITSFAIVSIAIIALLVSQWLPPSAAIPAVDRIDTFEIISSNDDLEMYQHLEFYLWLDEQKTGV